MTGFYVPGDSPLHRARPGAKLLALCLLLTVVAAVRRPEAVAIGAALVVAAYAVAGLGARRLAAQVWQLRWVLLLLTPFQLWQGGWRGAVVVVGGLVVAVTAAGLVTATTRVSDLLEVLVRALGPLRRVGVDPERVGLTLALTLRAVPVVAATFAEVRDARRARGLERSGRALLVPFVVRTVRHADRTGEALAARGVDD